MRIPLLTLAIVLAGTGWAGGALPIAKGLPLAAMNARLLADGWKPAHAPVVLTGGDVGALYRSGYKAVQMCAGTGKNPCIFNYTKNRKCLKIVTVGEYDPPENEPVVDTWSFACPDKD
jgi:hypothetical protein